MARTLSFKGTIAAANAALYAGRCDSAIHWMKKAAWAQKAAHGRPGEAKREAVLGRLLDKIDECIKSREG